MFPCSDCGIQGQVCHAKCIPAYWPLECLHLLVETAQWCAPYTCCHMFKVTRATTLCVFLVAGLPAIAGAQTAGSGSPSSSKQSEKSVTEGQEPTSPHPVQLDEQHRVITAGGFVKSGPVVFADLSEKASLTKWTHKMGTP